jgi:Pyridine nucleotide-disulphide oxidoreductase
MIEVAIVGAGPYGLSIAAHLRGLGIPFRIFGRPMDSWVSHMPKGSCLKSDGFASNIYDPNSEFTLEKYCSEQGIEYAHMGIPVHLETFSAYGLEFQKRLLPELDERMIEKIDQMAEGFTLQAEGGETFQARRVVLAVGIPHFAYVPESLTHLTDEHLSHSYRHRDLVTFRGRKVIVIGGGASALDLAGLLTDEGATVVLVARRPELKFHTAPDANKPRSLWKRLRHPDSGLGPGMRSRLLSDAPNIFHLLPASLRTKIVKKTLGPSGGWFIREKVEGRVSTVLGSTPIGARVKDGVVHLRVRCTDGSEQEVVGDHVITATGYKVAVDRLNFLAPELRTKVKTINETPKLNANFESSVPGLYFVGLAAANSFGPVMRFMFGAGFAARRVSESLAKSVKRNPASVAVRNVARVAD